MSYNDLFAPARERREAEDLTDMYIDLGENMLGMDMGAAKRIREQQKARGAPPSLGFSKALQGLVQEGFRHGYQRPLGPAVAEQMFPSTVITTTPPTGGLPPIYQQREEGAGPAPPWQAPTGLTDLLGGEAPWQPAPTTPGEATTTRRELTPLQQIIKQQVARGRPADVARMLPTIAEHFPEALEGGMAGDTKAQQKSIVDNMRATYPDMSSDLYNRLMALPSSMFRGPKLQQTNRWVRTEIHEDRQHHRLQGDDPETRRRNALAQFNSTLNIYMSRMDPADATRWRSKAGQARTAEDVYALEQQMGQTIPAQAPLTAQQTLQHEQQVTQHEQQLLRGFMDNMSKLNTVSGYLKGTLSHEQAGHILNLPGGGTIPVPFSIFAPTRPTTRPAPNTAQVQRFFETAFITLGRQIQNIRNLGKANPARAQEYDALATEYTQTLNDLQADYAGQLQGAGTPAGTPPAGGRAAPAATGRPAFEQDVTTAFQDALRARNIPDLQVAARDPAVLKAVLDAAWHTLLARGYTAQALQPRFQRHFPAWQPPPVSP